MVKKLQIFFSGFSTKKSHKTVKKKISRTHIKISRIFVNKFGQAGVYIARKLQKHAGMGGRIANHTNRHGIGPKDGSGWNHGLNYG
jgi:hypothetical protein